MVKTVRFSSPRYLGDPINVINLFNRFEVDEITLLDIGATRRGEPPPFELIERLAAECWVPLAYGGGIRTMEDVRTVLSFGRREGGPRDGGIRPPGADFRRGAGLRRAGRGRRCRTRDGPQPASACSSRVANGPSAATRRATRSAPSTTAPARSWSPRSIATGPWRATTWS